MTATSLHRLVALAVGICFFLKGTVAWAEDLPYLDFVHSLQERGQHDLALEYLLKLQGQNSSLPEEIKNLLPLEIARCRKELVAREQNSDKRAQLLRETRADLEAFVKNPANEKHPSLPELQLELALLSLDDGRRQIAKAQSMPDAATRTALNKAGLRLLDDAAAAFANVAKAAEQQLKDFSDAKDKKARDAKQRLQTALMNAQLNMGVASLEKSIHMAGDVKVSGAAQQTAQKIFDDLAGQRDQNPVGWIATAWLFRAGIGLDNSKVEGAYKRIMDEKKPEALPAQKLVRYFVILELATDARPDKWAPDPASKVFPPANMNVRTLAESWLKDYAKDANSLEGQHIRYLLGEQYLTDLQKMPAGQRQLAAGKELMDKTLKLFDALAATPGEYSREAANGKFQVLFLSGQARTKKIDELKTFDECLLRSQIEVMEARQAQEGFIDAVKKAAEETKLASETADKKEQEEHNKERDKQTKEAETKLQEISLHLQDMLKAARRSQTLMPENVKDKEHDLTYQLLYFAYFNRDWFRAAVASDFLAHNAREPDNAKEAAVNALKCYQRLTGQDATAGQRLVAIAELMERKWPTDLETDTARDILGRDLMTKKKYREAAEMFEKMSPRHPAYATCAQYAGVCWWVLHSTSAREARKPLNSPSPERDKAIAALERSVKKYEEQKDAADKKREVQARLYLAGDVYNSLGQYDKVLALLSPLLALVEKKELPADVPPNTETKILSLVLKAHVQKKDIDGAKKILDALKKRAGADDPAGAAALSEQLYAIGKQIRLKITDLEAQGEAARDELTNTKNSFREFLAELEKDPSLTPEISNWVGSSYASLSEYDKAIARFSAIKDPGDKSAPAAVQTYHSAMLQKAAAQRHRAAAEQNPGERRKLFDRAENDLTEIMKKPWAMKHPSFQKEKIFLLQDQDLYSGPKGAIAAWGAFAKSIERVMQLNEVQQNPARLKSFQEHYFDASYNLAYCMYKEAKQIQNKQKSDEAVKKAAERFNLLYLDGNVTAECKARIDQFLAEHRDLKREFDALNSKKG